MKITKSQLKEMVKEAVQAQITEQDEQAGDWWDSRKGIMTDRERVRMLDELYQRGDVDRATKMLWQWIVGKPQKITSQMFAGVIRNLASK